MRKLVLVLAVTALAPSLPTRSHAALVGLEGVMSTVMEEKQSSFSGLEFRARVHPDRLLQQIELVPSLEYWRNSSTISTYGIETTRKDATLGIYGRYAFEAKGWKPYAGVGWGVHFLSAQVNAPTLGLDHASNSLAKGGLALLGGASFGISDKIDNFLELKYHYIPDYKQLKINWGLTYHI